MSRDDFEVETIVGDIPKNATTAIRARIVLSHGKRCVDVRTFAYAGDGGLVPTRKGFTLACERAEGLRALVNDVCDAAGGHGPDSGECEGGVPIEV